LKIGVVLSLGRALAAQPVDPAILHGFLQRGRDAMALRYDQRRSLLTKEEARRIAANIAKLPKLLRKA
jgi:hypothetical protein